MRSSLFSSSWYRVADLQLRLRSHAQIHRHVYRGEIWYVLQDHLSGQFHRFTPSANLVIGLLDGQRSLQQIWQIVCDRLGDDVPSQDDIINLVSRLHKADVLQGNVLPDINEVEKRQTQAAGQKLKQYFKNPLSMRFPLLDPDKLLDKILPYCRWLFSWIGGLLWLLVVGSASVLAAQHWSALTENLLDRVFASENLLVMWLAYPLVKLFHEFGHALAVKVREVEVHEMGVMLLVLVPVPYVDASSASSFRQKQQRILVGMAGMMFEVFLAALAMFFWLDAQPGLARAFAYNIMMIAGVSTLIFNINPLLRLDGYYVLADWIEIPNLGGRANQYLAYLVNQYLFRVKNLPEPEETLREKIWFVSYAIAAFCYRMIVLFSIVFIIAGKFFFIGVLLACWSVYTGVFAPVFKQLKYVFSSQMLAERRSLAVSVVLLLVAVLGYGLWYVPFPAKTMGEGVVWAPEHSHIRSAQDCVIEQLLVSANQVVEPGQALFVCSDPEHLAKLQSYQAELQELQAKQAAVQQIDQVQQQILVDEITHVAARLADAQRSVAELTIRSPRAGQFLIQQPQDWPGRFVKRGDLLGFVLDFPLTNVLVVVRQTEVNMVRNLTRNVEIRTSAQLGQLIPAVITRAVPAATDKLPSLALSQQGGGEISLDPTKPGDHKALETVFVFDIKPQDPSLLRAIGGRVYVKFEHQPEPLARQWYARLRNLFLKQFSV